MKINFFLIYILAYVGLGYSQKSEELIPSEAITVFSLNNIKLLQKISMDQLVQYEFMEELQQELFDGSTNDKTIKDSGLDFDQKINVFLGKNPYYALTGITFGIANESNLFTVFDDFKQVESPYNDVKWYDSYINNLLIKKNTAILLRIEPDSRKVDLMTDSIWYSRGNSSPWEYWDEEFDATPASEFDEDSSSLGIDVPVDENEPVAFPEDNEMLMKNYYELRDSIQFSLQQYYEKQVLEDLFFQNKRLVLTDKRFADQLAHETEGSFYFDYSRKIDKNGNLFYFKGIMPDIYSNINELYTDNIILGDLVLVDDHLEFQMETKYNEKLGAIYTKLGDTKMDKSVKNYIHENCPAFFVYKVNLREAYEKAFEIVMPILAKETKDNDLIANALMLDLLNEFINKDALFDTYKGSFFGSFNGVKKIKTSKVEFIYDEETFDYYEKESEAEEDMPIFTLGISTKRHDVPEKILSYLSKILATRKNGQLTFINNQKGKEYYIMDKAILNSAPLYMINKNGLFIMTNDEDLAKNYSNGYENKAISSKELKKAEKGGILYAKMDLNSTVNLFPRDVFSAKENELIDALRGKSGKMEMTTTKTNLKSTKLNLVYDFKAETDGPGKHVLDLINAIYVLTR
jgi:hypothetical protein